MMKGKKNLHCLLLGALLSVSTWSFAQQVPTTAELIQQPVYKTSWQKMIKGQKNLPAWARKGAGTSAPAEWVEQAGKKYQIGSICKPHDCASHFLLVAFSDDKKQAWGVRVSVEDKPEALEAPSKFAQYQWLGQPDEAMKALLIAQLEKDPNWK